MPQRLVRVKTSNGVIAGYNNVGATGTLGERLANLVDSTGSPTGISFHVTSAFSTSGGSGTWVTSGFYGLAENFFEWAWTSPTNGVGVFQLRGFYPGKAVTINLSGYGFSTTRHTDFFVNGVAVPRYINTAGTPNPLVSIDAIADSNGYITITGNLTSNNWYFGGLTFTYDDQPIIQTVGTLTAGEVVAVTTNTSTFAPNTVTLSNNGIDKTVTATPTGNGNFTFTTPNWVEGQTGLLYGTNVSITASDGVLTTYSYAGPVLNPPANRALKTLGSLLSTRFDLSHKVGTQCLYDYLLCRINDLWEVESLTFNGEFWVESTYRGFVNILYRDPDDKIIRKNELNFNNRGAVNLSSWTKNTVSSPVFDADAIGGGH